MSKRGPIHPSVAALALMLVFASGAVAADCPAGLAERTTVDLFFGRNIGAKVGVSEQAFRAFVDREVSPRFPDGFTVVDIRGQYRDSRLGTIIREPGKLIVIALADDGPDLIKVRALVDAYKQRFRQQSVGIVWRRACVAF